MLALLRLHDSGSSGHDVTSSTEMIMKPETTARSIRSAALWEDAEPYVKAPVAPVLLLSRRIEARSAIAVDTEH